MNVSTVILNTPMWAKVDKMLSEVGMRFGDGVPVQHEWSHIGGMPALRHLKWWGIPPVIPAS